MTISEETNESMISYFYGRHLNLFSRKVSLMSKKCKHANRVCKISNLEVNLIYF